MIFKEAYEHLKAGRKVRRPHWVGYWVLDENEKIRMHLKDGNWMYMTDTEQERFTIGCMLFDDWTVVDEGVMQPRRDIQTLTFGEALREMKNGKKVTREKWKQDLSKPLEQLAYCELVGMYYNDHFDAIEKPTAIGTWTSFIAMKTSDNQILPWQPNQEGLLAQDWIVINK